jgi:hypothetical protein
MLTLPTMRTEPDLPIDTNADRTTTVRLSGVVGRETLAAVRRAFELPVVQVSGLDEVATLRSPR